MYITLKMEMQDQEFDLEVNLANRAGRIYREQYSRDMLKDMSDLYKKINRPLLEGFDISNVDVNSKSEQEIYKQIVASVDMPNVLSKWIEKETLDFEETERAGQIIWAFAKNRDKDIPSYEDWIDSFDFILPVDQIIMELYDAWGKSAKPTVKLKK